MNKLNEETGAAILFITHDLGVIAQMAEEVAVMYLGKVVEAASYRDLYATPKHPYTQSLLSAVPKPDPKIRRERIILKGDVPSPIHPPAGCRFHPRCPKRMDICSQSIPELRDLEAKRELNLRRSRLPTLAPSLQSSNLY
mgnify:CR=1 FL=1